MLESKGPLANIAMQWSFGFQHPAFRRCGRPWSECQIHSTAHFTQERRPQVEGQREFHRPFFRWRVDTAGGMAMLLEAGQPARLGLVGVDRLGLVVASAGMGDMIDAAADRAAAPGVDEVEGQRRMHGDRRMQRRGRLPGLKRTPATNSPAPPVPVIGTRRPLQVTTWRPSLMPVA